METDLDLGIAKMVLAMSKIAYQVPSVCIMDSVVVTISRRAGI